LCDIGDGENLLSGAADSGRIEKIEFLLTKEAFNIASFDHLGMTLLHWVAREYPTTVPKPSNYSLRSRALKLIHATTKARCR
jgi:hypothetical protein